MPWLDVDLEDEDGVALQKGKYLRTDRRDIEIAVIQVPHIANFTDFNALAAQPDVRVRYVRQPQELAGVDMIILPGSKIRSATWAGCARAAWRTRYCRPAPGRTGAGDLRRLPMLGETIIDEVESGLGTQPGLGLLNTVTTLRTAKRPPR
ncbi:cobyric acid synthase [Klebsiella michiganensis]|nr:cobyric acid synthase [Klebsiella michiganensis]